MAFDLEAERAVVSNDRKRLAVVPSSPYWDRDPRVLGNSITPELLSKILRDRNLGYLRDWVDFCNEIRRNSPHLHSQLAIREESVVETEFVIEPGDTSAEAKLAADACTALWKSWRTRGLLDWIAQLTAAVYYGRTAHEVVWERTDGLMVPVELVHIDERRLSYACDPSDTSPWRIRLWDQELGTQPLYGIPLDTFGDDKVLVHTPRVLGGPITAEGLASNVVWYVVFAIWAWRDLMSLSELIGQQPVLGVYAAGGAQASTSNEFAGAVSASPEQVKHLERVVYGMSGALRAVIPDTGRIEFPKFNLPTGQPVQLLAEERSNALVSKAVNGVANLSDLQPGARAAVETQERTTYTFWRADCRRVAAQFQRVLAWFIRANPVRFGARCATPTVRAVTEVAATTTSPAGGKPPALPGDGGANGG